MRNRVPSKARAAMFLLAALISTPVAAAAGDTPLTISGTIEYTGSRGPVSGTQPIVLVATRRRALDGIPVAIEIVTDNGGSFELTVPEAGDYHLFYALDTNGDSIPNLGDPFGVYEQRVSGPADPISVPVSAAQSNLIITFDDTAGLPGVFGTVTYTGALEVNNTQPLRVQVFRDGYLTDRVDREQRIVVNGGSYDFLLLEPRLYYMQVFVDLDDNDELDEGEPFEIYPERQRPPGDPLPEGVAEVNVIFGDGPDPTPTPVEALSVSGTVEYTGALGPVSSDHPILVHLLTAVSIEEAPAAIASVTENGGSFALEAPAAGDYFLGYVLDVDGDGQASVGEPYEAYQDKFEPPADTVSVPTSGLALSFDDSALLSGTRGTAYYAGIRGTVSTDTPIQLALFADEDLTSPLSHDRTLTVDGEAFQFLGFGIPQYLVAYLDLDGNNIRDPDEPYTIYNRRSDAPADPLPQDQGATPVNVIVSDDTAATPTPTQGEATLTPTGEPTPSPVACVGDCDGDGVVTVSELITGVNIALELLGVDGCFAMDADGSGTVTVNELILGVNSALNGCPEVAATTSQAGSGEGSEDAR